MAYCRGSIAVGKTTTPVDVLLSTGAGSCYISERTASNLKIPLPRSNKLTTIASHAAGRESTCRTTTIDLTLGTLRHKVEVLIMPGDEERVVLGSDWFHDYDLRMNFGARIFTAVDNQGVAHPLRIFQKESETVFLPSMTVVEEKVEPQVQTAPKRPRKKRSKASARNRMVKERWGSRPNFQASYGLTMTPDDIEEGNRILNALGKEKEGEV